MIFYHPSLTKIFYMKRKLTKKNSSSFTGAYTLWDSTGKNIPPIAQTPRSWWRTYKHVRSQHPLSPVRRHWTIRLRSFGSPEILEIVTLPPLVLLLTEREWEKRWLWGGKEQRVNSAQCTKLMQVNVAMDVFEAE